MKVGIVGMPNAGKSSLFNALTRAGAEAANYPFTTIEPNVAVVPVEDERLNAVAETVGASSVVPDTIDFHDIAGLVAGAHKGEGLGNQFLANIRETDAILHVVRAHEDENVIHPEGRVDPLADIETIETELIYADLEQAERRHARIVRDARSGDKTAVAEEAWLRAVVEALQAGRPARSVPVPADAPNAMRDLSPLTGKPVRFVANVDEVRGAYGPRDLLEALVAHGHHGDVRLDRRERVVRRLGAGPRQRVEQGRLARVGHPDDADLHRPRLPTTVPSAAPAATSEG